MRLAVLSTVRWHYECIGHVLEYARARGHEPDVFLPTAPESDEWVAMYRRLGYVFAVRDAATFAAECGCYTHVVAMTPDDAAHVPDAAKFVFACIVHRADMLPTLRTRWHVYLRPRETDAEWTMPVYRALSAGEKMAALSARPSVALIGSAWAHLGVEELRATFTNFDELDVLVVSRAIPDTLASLANVEAHPNATPEAMLSVVARAHFVAAPFGSVYDHEQLSGCVHLALATGTRLIISATQNAYLRLGSALVVEGRVPALHGAPTEEETAAVFVDLEGAVGRRDALYDRIVASKPSKRKIHVLGVPHTIVSDAYDHCPLTSRMLRFARMMRPLGCTVVEYSNGNSESGADTQVQILAENEVRALDADARASTFAARALRAVSVLAAPGEVVLHVLPDASVVEALPACLHVDWAVDGACDSPCPFRVCESASWASWHGGLRHLEFGTCREFVAPSYHDCADLDVVVEPPETPTVLFMGAMQSKSLATVLAVARAMPTVRFVLCGRGDAALASERNTVHAPPVLGRARSAMLGAATALLAPEPHCTSHVEAQMCGTPVLCSVLGACTVEDGKTGYVCRTLADYVVAVAHAGLLDRSYVASRARSAFSLRTVGNRYDEIFLQVAEHRRIPKLRFCTGPFARSEMPGEFARILVAQQALSADHEVRYFDRMERDAFVVQHFPQYREHYRNLLPGAYQADLWRLMVVYVHGGVYADLATQFARPLSTVIRPTDELVMCIDAPTDPAGICNALIAARPRHPALLLAIERIVRTRLEPRDKGEFTLDVAGPQALGRAVRFFLRGEDDGAAFVAGDYGTHRLLTYALPHVLDELGAVVVSSFKCERYYELMYAGRAHYFQLWHEDRVFRDVAAARCGATAAYVPLRRYKGLFSTLLEWAECQIKNPSVEVECVDWPAWLVELLPHAPVRTCPSEWAVDARHVPAMVPDTLMQRPDVLGAAVLSALLAPLHALVAPGAPLSPSSHLRSVAAAWWERELGDAGFVVGVHGRAAVHFDAAPFGLEEHTRGLCEAAREELATSGRRDARVLLTSCNATIALQVRETLGAVSWREPEGVINEGNVDWGLHTQELTKEIATGALIDALLLSMCDVVVCGSSNVVLYAAALRPAMRVRVARHLCAVRGL
jgi:glycosyltransferase involved in cell wall biosynthesis